MGFVKPIGSLDRNLSKNELIAMVDTSARKSSKAANSTC